MRRRSAVVVTLLSGLVVGGGCELVEPPARASAPGVEVAWTPGSASASGGSSWAVQAAPSSFLWSGETLELALVDAEGVTHRRTLPLGPSGVREDASFRIAPGPFTATASVIGNGAGLLLQGSVQGDGDRVTLPLQAVAPVLAVAPVSAGFTDFSPDTFRVWNLGSDPMEWALGTLDPPNGSCPGGRCMVFRIADRSAIAPGAFREVLVAGWDTPGGAHRLTLVADAGSGQDRVVLPIQAGPARPVGRITVEVTLAGAPLPGTSVELVGPDGARFQVSDGQGRAVFEDLGFGTWDILVSGASGESVDLDPFSKDVLVRVAF